MLVCRNMLLRSCKKKRMQRKVSLSIMVLSRNTPNPDLLNASEIAAIIIIIHLTCKMLSLVLSQSTILYHIAFTYYSIL
jgi:hypothetical protein